MATSLLNFPSSAGCRVSTKKASIACQSVIYIGFTVPRGYQSLGSERNEAACQIPEPKSKWEMQASLGTAGCCRLWIPNCGLMEDRGIGSCEKRRRNFGLEPRMPNSLFAA